MPTFWYKDYDGKAFSVRRMVMKKLVLLLVVLTLLAMVRPDMCGNPSGWLRATRILRIMFGGAPELLTCDPVIDYDNWA